MKNQKILFLYDEIKSVINQWDPIDLVRFCDDEYDDEIDKLLKQLRPSSTVEMISRYLKKIFKSSFGDVIDCNDEKYVEIAQQIYDIIHTK